MNTDGAALVHVVSFSSAEECSKFTLQPSLWWWVWASHNRSLLELSRVVPDFYTVLTYFTCVSSSYWHAFRLHVLIYLTLSSFLLLGLGYNCVLWKIIIELKKKKVLRGLLCHPCVSFPSVHGLISSGNRRNGHRYKCYSHRHVTHTDMSPVHARICYWPLNIILLIFLTECLYWNCFYYA